MSRAVIVGFGITGQAVAGQLVERGHDVVATDDAPGVAPGAAASRLGVDLVASPDETHLTALMAGADLFVPSPGVPECHPAFAVARRLGLAPTSELDLAVMWDTRPCLAVTGTNGKTTVVEQLAAAFGAAGRRVVAAGNTAVPLVEAIRDPAVELFVVEASSFRLAPTTRFAPAVGTWLNFSPDHLDVHTDLDVYERSKSKVFERAGVCVANADDPVVMRNVPTDRPVVTFGHRTGADVTLVGEELVARGEVVTTTGALWRDLPHDVDNALAVIATVVAASGTAAGGVPADALAGALGTFEGLAHRVSLVAERGGVRWYDDSKATTPHAVLAALAGFDSVVLIAGGRAKGVDLAALVERADVVRAVVGLGEAGPDVVGHFAGLRPTVVAGDMATAVARAAELARPGDAVLLSPGCASFDAYRDYAHRGDDFAEQVRRLHGEQT